MRPADTGYNFKQNVPAYENLTSVLEPEAPSVKKKFYYDKFLKNTDDID